MHLTSNEVPLACTVCQVASSSALPLGQPTPFPSEWSSHLDRLLSHHWPHATNGNRKAEIAFYTVVNGIPQQVLHHHTGRQARSRGAQMPEPVCLQIPTSATSLLCYPTLCLVAGRRQDSCELKASFVCIARFPPIKATE